MKIIFAGTPEFALPSLQALLDSDHQIIAVYTQPDRPSGRGQKLVSSPVKLLAEQHKIPVYQPKSLRDVSVQQQLAALKPDVMAVVAYGLLLPKAVLNIPKHGCVNVHPSILPRWRGAAPLQRTILAGDKETAVATMQLDVGMDTGPILMLEKTAVKPNETSGQLHDRLAIVGGALLVKTFDLMVQGKLDPTPQSTEGVLHAAKVTKKEAKIDWEQPATRIHNLICGYNPWPVAHTLYFRQVLRIWEAEVINEKIDAFPGVIIQATKAGIDVATTKGMLRITRLQLPGGKPLTAAEFLNREHGRIEINTTRLG